MKGVTLIGLVLAVLGLAGLIWPVITYTETEQVLDVGPLEVTADNENRVPIPPLASGLALAAGVALVVAGSRGRR
jgi:hypothetical protein